MNYYGGKEIAASFRTVRNNTLKIAEEIPEAKYSFSPAPGVRTVAQTLNHIGNVHKFALMLHRDQPELKTLEGFDFMKVLGPVMAAEQETLSKEQLVQKLTLGGEEFEGWVSTLSEDFLGEVITMPTGGNPASRTRFDMIIAVKEHEMHHRGQLMIVERMIGITPHLTRSQQERFAAMQAAHAAKQ
jgi:uncharacterized damage-inducible protein DinB